MEEIKKKKCKNCKKPFTPFRTTDTVCSVQCATEYKQTRQKQKEGRKTAIKEVDRKLLMQSARLVFNSYIRERDKNETCICCGKPLGSGYHAGHYFSGGGHANVMFDELNVHGQRADCNTGHRATILTEHTMGIIERIGSDEYILLKERAYEVKKWSNEELQGIIETYKRKTKELKNGKSNV